MRQIPPIFRREFASYFRSPVAYVYLVVFLTASVGLAFFVGQFFQANVASLERYFMFYPWLFLFLIPAAGMRLWSEEKRSGTVELLLTLPVTTAEAVVGKFLAAWLFLMVAIGLSFPMAVTIGYLGVPDWGVVATSYLGSILLAGTYLGICSLASSLTQSQVISFVVGVLACAIFIFLGWSVFSGLLAAVFPVTVIDAFSNFSFVTHFDPFIRGLVDPKDIVFFLSLTGFALAANVIVLERHQLRSAGFRANFLSLALLLVGLIPINYLASAVPVRIDATADRIYTLSRGTKALLAKIADPITLDFYDTRGQGGLKIEVKNYAGRIREILRQYVRASHGKMALNVIDTETDTPEEIKATAAGLRPQRMQPGSEPFYLGIAASQGERQKALSTLTPNREQFLEYDISELIYGVQQEAKQRLGLLTSLPLLADEQPPSDGQPARKDQLVVKEWKNTFEIVPLEANATELPARLDVLALVGPPEVSPQLQYAIDQFLLGGKPVFLAVDPSSQHFKRLYEKAMQSGTPPPKFSSNLPALIGGWGLNYDPAKIVGDNESATQVQIDKGTLVRDPIWLSLGRGDLNSSAPPTAQLGSLFFVEAGSIALKAGSALAFTPLVQTSAGAGELPVRVQFAFPDKIGAMIAPSGRKTIAALVAGKFPTAFPKGPPVAANATGAAAAKGMPVPKPAAPGESLKESKKSSNLVIVADTDWILDEFGVRTFDTQGTTAVKPLNDNLALAANALDFLAGSDDLISVRGKGSSLRPFTVVQGMESQANERFQEKVTGLESELNGLQSKIQRLQQDKTAGNGLLATPEATKAIDEFQQRQAILRNELRIVRLELRRGIDALGNGLLAINLLASPLMVCMFGVWYQRNRRK